MSKSILFITGTRADYGKIAPLAVAARDAGFKVTFFITGMHMLNRYGDTRIEVKKFQGADFFEFVNQREGDELDLILSKTILGFSDFVHEHKPDLVVIHGDRIEAMAASIVCSMNYILSAHIEGGEISGTIDESIRHCNSKLCHSHFVSSTDAAKRVIALGESSSRVFIIGSPELDVHSSSSGVSIDEVKRYYSIKFEDFGIVIFHPVTSEVESIRAQAESLFKALMLTGRNYVVILPNNDPGSAEIFSVINGLPHDKFKVVPSMRFNYFSELMKNASIMIGNSSAGVREAPFIGIPSLDVGSRQGKRAISDSVVKVDAFAVNEIVKLINDKWGVVLSASGGFGDGGSSKKFLQILNSRDFWELSLQKNYSEDWR